MPEHGIIIEPGREPFYRAKLPGDRIADVNPILGDQAQLCVGPADTQVYDDVYTYRTFKAAITAVLAWDGTGEPDGWHRHQPSNRRRPGGDPSKEYVRE